MAIRDETLLLIAGGVLVVGLIARKKILDMAVADDAAALPGGAPPATSYLPPLVEAPGPPLMVTPPASSTPPAASSTTPPAAASSATPAGPTAAAQNAAFEASMALAHADQAAYLADQTDQLKAAVARGDIQVGSPAYVSTMAYLASLGGIAHQAETTAGLHAAGLAGRAPRRERPRLRLV